MRLFGLVVLGLVVCSCGWAQSTQQGLEAELGHQSFYLVGLWKGNKLHFSGEGKLTDSPEMTSPLLSSVEIEKVEMKDDRLELTGRRQAIVYQGGKPQTYDFGKTVHLEIRRPDSGDYGSALALILTPRLGDLAGAAPEIWRSFLLQQAAKPIVAGQGAASTTPGAGAARVRKVGGGVTPPVVLKAPEPVFSDEARGFKAMRTMDAKVLVYLQVGADGTVSHVRILKSYGLGLDEKAAGAVEQYRFKPAMEGDRPVPVELNVEVRFQKY